MDPIKIVDKLTLRQEALRMAVELSKSHPKMVSDTIKNADIFEDYIKGSADLPEYVDPNADKQQWVDMLNKMREEMKPNPWISVDSEMKPNGDSIVLVRCEGYENPQLGKYLEEDCWEVRTETLLQSKLNEVKVIAWMPIPPFVEPLKL